MDNSKNKRFLAIIEESFNRMDTNEDDVISIDEFQRFFQEFGKHIFLIRVKLLVDPLSVKIRGA